MTIRNLELHLPQSGEVTEADLWLWYSNLEKENQLGFLTPEEIEKIKAYYVDAGLFSDAKRAYFRSHFSRSFAAAAQFLLSGQTIPHIVDLGCGTGSQSLYLALRGARVTGIDMDTDALEILKKRKSFYEQKSGKKLDITLLDANCFDVDYGAIAPIDGVYSMFAFNMMQPSAALIDTMMADFSPNARIVVIDGNNQSWIPKLVPSRRRNAWSPVQFATELEKRGFSIEAHSGAISVPPPLWSALPSIAKRLDPVLNNSWLFAISHQILAQKAGSE